MIGNVVAASDRELAELGKVIEQERYRRASNQNERIRETEGKAMSGLPRDPSFGHTMGAGDAPERSRHELTIENVDDAFRYHPWDSQQTDRGAQVRDALVNAAKVLLRVVPRSPARTRALNMLQDARMLANHSITHGGDF